MTEIHFDTGQDGHDHISALLAQHSDTSAQYVEPTPYSLNTPMRQS